MISHAVGEEASGIGQNLSTRESCLTDAPSPSRCRDMRHLDFQMSSTENPSLPVELVPATDLFDGRLLEARDSVTADLGSPPVRFGRNPRFVQQTQVSLGLARVLDCVLTLSAWSEVNGED